MADITINNPTRWFYGFAFDAEWWHQGGKTREECIAAAAMGGEPIWIVEAKHQVPNFAIFDAEDLLEHLSEQDCWGEGGAEGLPVFDRGAAELTSLEAELAAVLQRWYFANGGDLLGAQLDFTHGPERIDPVKAA